MKNLKKGMLMCAVLLTGLCGVKARAAELDQDMTREKLVANTQKTMESQKVVSVAVDAVAMQFTITTDQNTKITMIESIDGTEKIWLDQNKGYIYTCDSLTKEYYVEPLPSEVEKEVMDSVTTVQISDDYKYTGIKKYNGKQCYCLTGKVSQDKTTYDITLYIGEDYKVVGAVTKYNYMSIICDFSYPDKVTIPAEVVKNATISEGYRTTVANVIYEVHNVKNKPVLHVVSSPKAKSNVVIKDSIIICGKTCKVTTIDGSAFAGNKKIKSVVIGKNVTTISSRAFYKCKKLKKVTIKSSAIKSVGTRAFYGNAKKLRVKVPKKKVKKYKKLLNKSKVSSKLTVTK